MRRTIFLALLAALLLVPAAAHAAGSLEIIRDCADDSELQGSYTASELRKARSDLPTDIDEYSDCRDVLGRAIAATTSSSNGGGGGGGGGLLGTGGGGGGTGSGPDPVAGARQAERTAALAAPSSPADAKAVGEAAALGDQVVSGADPKSPGSSRLAAQVGRNALPGPVVVVLALLAAALAAMGLPFLRRRRVVADAQT